MSGPRSPARKAKEAQAKFRNRNVKPSYKPSAESVVHKLSTKLTDAQRSWWDRYRGPGKEFHLAKDRRGSQNGGMAFIRELFVTKCWGEYFPEAKGASEEDRAWFFKNSGMSKLLWAYLDNPLRGEKKKDEPAQGSSSKTGKVMQRAIAHDAYRREHPEKFGEAVQNWAKEHGSEPKLNDRNKISIGLYNGLSNQDKKDFKDKAIAKVKQSRELAKITDPQERAKFTQDFWFSLKEFLAEVSEKAGIEVCALVVHETEDGRTKVTRELSAGIEAFENSPALAKSMDALRSFLETRSDIEGPGDIPRPQPRVYPDYTRDGYPTLPDFRGWSLRRLRKLLRDFIKAVFKFQGGVGRVMWTEIKAAMDYWLDPQRIGKDRGLVWDAPDNLCKEMVLLWLEFFLACLTGVIPSEKRFQFFRVPAGPTPIHPSESQETGRELVEREGKMVYVLVFGDEVDKCHLVGGMTYDRRAIDYAKFVAFGRDHANANSAPPARWLGLPTFGPNVPLSVFSGEELQRLNSWATLLPEVAQARVRTVIEVTNTYQEHLPSIHPLGIWMRESPLPLIFPRTPDEASSPWASFWLPDDYFKPFGIAAVAGTLYHFEVCQNELHDGDLILHEPSHTLYGGDTGVVCMMRALIHIYLNCLAVRGDFDPPEEVPPNYDISRFNVQEHDRITSWIDKWVALIKSHTDILAQTSPERKAGLAEPRVLVSSKDSDSESSIHSDDEDYESHPHPAAVPATSAAPPFASTPGPSTAGPSKVSKGKQPERARRLADFSESSEDSSEEDFEILDVTSQDEKSSDEEDWNRFLERHIDDDVFPSGDPIGLKERYGFDPEVEFEHHFGCGPAAEVDMRWPSPNEPLFGGFPELQPYKAPRLTRAETIMRQLIGIGSQAFKANRRWEIFNLANPRFYPQMEDAAREESYIFPAIAQPLVQLLYSRILSWLRAQAAAPCVFAHWQAMAYILREALDLFATAQRLLDADDFPNPEFTAEDLTTQVKRTKSQVVGISYACSELKDWYNLAVEAVEKLDVIWMPPAIPELRGIIKIVDGILWWSKETDKLAATHLADRPVIWKELMGTPYQRADEGMNYIFGCASSLEVAQNLPDALKAAREIDPSLVVMEGVVRNIDLILTGVIPTILAPTRPPARSLAPTTTSSTALPERSTVSGSGSDAEGDREMGVDVPTVGASELPASPEPQAKSRPRPKMRPAPVTSPGIVEQTPVVVPATATEPTPPSPNEKPARKSADGSTPTSPAEERRPDDGEPNNGAVETTGAPPSSPQSDIPQTSEEIRPNSKSKAKPKASHPPPPPSPTPPRTRQSLKRKPDQETENETDIDIAQGKRASARLQAKSGASKATGKSKQEDNARRVLTRRSRT